MDGTLRILSVLLSFCGIAVASRVRHAAASHHSEPVPLESTKSFASGFSLFSGNSNDDAPSRFIQSFKIGWKSAAFAHGGKRYKDEATGIEIKTWRGINNRLAPLRNSIVPNDGEDLIERVFASKITEKFFGDGGVGGGKSGAKMYILPHDEETGYSYILKGEDRDFVKQGVWPILGKYAEHLDPTVNLEHGACEESTMMKVLMVFEPLNVHKSVNNKVWMLFTNINTLPMAEPNFHVSISYDLKHSREFARCSSDGTDDEGAIGYLGDFLREWERPLRRATQKLYAQVAANNGNATATGFGDTSYSKTTCLMKALAHDFAVLDSAYPSAKLVDQSALVTMVQLRDADDNPRGETEAETAIVDSHNNIFRITRDDGTQWHMVIGLIDLFANKLAQKWKRFQSHAGSKDYIFEMKKFSMYPFQLGCLLQYMFYYQDFPLDDYGKLQSAVVNDGEGRVSYSWEDECITKGDTSITYKHDDLGSNSVRKKIHKAGQMEFTCSLMKTCHALLTKTSFVPGNMQQCCQKGRYAGGILGVGGESC